MFIEPPSEMAARSLIMVAKCLQNLANLVEFGGKEPYMEVVNPFILKNKERMVVFLDQLSVRIFSVISANYISLYFYELKVKVLFLCVFILSTPIFSLKTLVHLLHFYPFLDLFHLTCYRYNF